MSEASEDTLRAVAACKSIFDGRHPQRDMASVLVTAEHAIAALLLAMYPGDPATAARMLNEGLVEGIERRLSLYASKI